MVIAVRNDSDCSCFLALFMMFLGILSSNSVSDLCKLRKITARIYMTIQFIQAGVYLLGDVIRRFSF